MHFTKSVIIALAAATELVAAHGAIVAATGDMGGAGEALGINPATPRDSSRRDPGQQDSTRFRNVAPDTCGETLGGGENDIAGGLSAAAAAGAMPVISPGGMVMMTLHQVNGDGAGPYECMIDATGTGTNWTPMQVATNVPGENSRSDAKSTDFPLTAMVAANQNCTGTAGGVEGICMVRCNNDARAGPFGGCVPVQMATADAATPAAGAASASASAIPAASAGGAKQSAGPAKASVAAGATKASATAKAGTTGAKTKAATRRRSLKFFS